MLETFGVLLWGIYNQTFINTEMGHFCLIKKSSIEDSSEREVLLEYILFSEHMVNHWLIVSYID